MPLVMHAMDDVLWNSSSDFTVTPVMVIPIRVAHMMGIPVMDTLPRTRQMVTTIIGHSVDCHTPDRHSSGCHSPDGHAPDGHAPVALER